MNVSSSLRLDPAEALAMQRAFSTSRDRDVSADGKREAVACEDRLVVREDGHESLKAWRTKEGGVPRRPTISGNGRALAWLVEGEGNCSHVEFASARSGLSGLVDLLSYSRTMISTMPIAALDLSHDGRYIAYAQRDQVVISGGIGNATMGDRGFSLPEVEGRREIPIDVEFLPSGRVAVESRGGRYYVVDPATSAVLPVSLKAFDSKRWETRFNDAATRMPELRPDELEDLLDLYGDSLAGGKASPDGHQVLLQLKRGQDQRDNILLDRATGRRFSLGPSRAPDPANPATAPRWSDDGQFVVVEGDRHLPVSHLVRPWDVNLGQDVAPPEKENAGVVCEEEAILVGGIRIPRRSEPS